MKKIKVLFMMSAMAFAGVTTFNACTDPCKDVTCVNGECSEGDCVCDAGYEGTDCGTEERAKFTGSYSFTDQCYPGTSTSSTLSTSSAAIDRVLISNILGTTLQGQAYGEISGSSITIPSQTVTDVDGDAWTVQSVGSGTIANGVFTITVKFTFGSNTQDCQLTFTKS